MNAASGSRSDKRWWVLGVVAVAQLMVVLDGTIVNVALPSAQAALGFSAELRQWVVTVYALGFGSLLLLGGRIGDLFGRKWTFVGGALGFGLASAVGGSAQSFGMLISARAAQGVFAAMLAPSALALLTTTFPEGRERNRAFGLFSAVSGSGAALGLLLGGVLTEFLSWRYSLFVNLLMAIPAAAGALWLVSNNDRTDRPALDLPGTLAGCGGLFCLVYGVSNAETNPWTAPLTLIMLVAAAALLVGFVIIESRSRHPLLPLRVVADRARGGAFLAIGVAGMALLGAFLFLTYFLQQTLGESPLLTGVSFLPVAAAIVLSAGATNAVLLPRFGPRPLVVAGLLLGAAAMVWLARLTPESDYAAGVLPGLILMGLGMGLAIGAGYFTATYGVQRQDAGVASAMVDTAQQIGGGIGAALLSTISASAMQSYHRSSHPTPQTLDAAAVHGYTVAFWVAAGIFTGGAILLGFMLPSIGAAQPASEDDDRHETGPASPDAEPPGTETPGRVPAQDSRHSAVDHPALHS